MERYIKDPFCGQELHLLPGLQSEEKLLNSTHKTLDMFDLNHGINLIIYNELKSYDIPRKSTAKAN